MAVTFVIGRAGSGKTRRCFDSIVAAMRANPLGPPIYWIVPKQATFMAERELTCASGLGGFCRARVVSFDLLGREVFAHAGGNVIPEVTSLGRQMVIGHLLRRHQPKLGFFKSSARLPGLAAELDATFGELERSGKSAADLALLVADMESARPVDVDAVALLAKLRDVRLLYDAYATFLGQDRLDPHRRLELVLKSVADCPPLRGSTVYVDGFTEFTDYERRVLAAVAKVAARMEVTLLIDPGSPTVRDPHVMPDEGSLFHQTESAYRRLWFAFAEENVTVTDPVLPEGNHRFRGPALAHIERELFTAHPPRSEAPSSSGVELLEAPDRRAEVDAVARGVRRLLREGFRLRDVAVLVRDLEAYHGLIDTSFREHGIPFFADRRRTAAHHPLLQFVRCAFQIARHDWPHDPTMALLKTGLAGLTLYEADAVENYVLLHRIRGGEGWERPDPWAYRRELTRRRDGDEGETGGGGVEARTVDLLRRRVADHLKPLIRRVRSGQAMAVRDFAAELFAVVERFRVRQAIETWARDAESGGRLEEAREHEQVWAELVELFDQMVDLLGDERVHVADFVDVLESGLERFDLALTPPTVDQVLVGQVDRTHTPPGLRAAFVLGMNDGEFPRAFRDQTILADHERRELRRRHVELDADAERRRLDERLLAYVAFTRPAERLSLSRPRDVGSGQEAAPSPFWDEVRAILPDVPVESLPQERRGDVRYIDTPGQLIVSLMHWVRDGNPVGATLVSPSAANAIKEGDTSVAPTVGEGPSRTPWPVLYHWLASYHDKGDGVDLARHRAWWALGYVNEARLSPEIASELFPAPLQASGGQLETFAACPFRHFLRHGLRLTGREEQGVTALDLSQVYHRVLDVVVGEALERRADWRELTKVITPQAISEYAQMVGQMLRGELMLSTARNRYLLQRVEKTLEEVLAAQCEAMRRGQFRPAYTDVRFGEQGRLPAYRVETPGGNQVLLRGKIDRVDLLPAGGDFAVIDYRLGANSLSLGEAFHGLSLQLLTYLLVLQANGEELGGKPLTPAAAFYLQMSRRLGDVEHPSEALDPANPRFHLRVKPRGVFDGRYLPALDSQLGEGKSDVVQAHVKKGGGFGFRNASDAAEPAEFEAILRLVRRRIGELADEILAGKVDIRPYRINRETPCPRCEFRSVCRFDPASNNYRHLPALRREDVLNAVTGGGGSGDGE